MTNTTHPPKQRVRDYMDRRTHSEESPPTPEDIRRELGWAIIEAEREARDERERSE